MAKKLLKKNPSKKNNAKLKLTSSRTKQITLLVFVLVFAGIGLWLLTQSKAAGTPMTAAQCLARPNVTRLTGPRTSQFRTNSTTDMTVDARGMIFSNNTPVPIRYPIILGVSSSTANSNRTCWIGGTVFGNIPWNLGWMDWYDQQGSTYDGDGIEIGTTADWDVIDGFRADNISDGIMTFGRAPAESVMRNLYFTNIRDDCLELDSLPRTTTVLDSYFECYSGISQEPTDDPPPTSGTTTTMDNVLMWIKPMTSTSCRNTAVCADGNGAFVIFKMRGSQTPTFTVKNSVFRVDEPSEWGQSDYTFPSNIRFENTKLVWTGRAKWGNFPASIPAGITLTEDINVWNNAKATWLSRHGCPAGGDTTGTSCTKMINPDPIGGTPPPGDTTSPTVSISSPSNGSSASGTINVSATASDNVGVNRVEFYVDGSLRTSDTTSPYGFSLDTTSLSNASHSLTAKAFDAAGNNTTSSAVNISVNNQAPAPTDTVKPVVSWLTPAAGAVVSGETYIDVLATDNVGVTKVEYSIDNGPINNTEASAPYDWHWTTTNHIDGIHTITAIAYDAAGNTTSLSRSFTVNNNSTPPPVFIPEDVNVDGHVNILDFSLLSSKFGQTTNLGRADINMDGKVSIIDFSLLAAKFGI